MLEIIIIIIIIIIVSFSHQLMVFHGWLSDSKSPQDSMTLLCILTDRNNVVVWRVSDFQFFCFFFDDFGDRSKRSNNK